MHNEFVFLIHRLHHKENTNSYYIDKAPSSPCKSLSSNPLNTLLMNNLLNMLLMMKSRHWQSQHQTKGRTGVQALLFLVLLNHYSAAWKLYCSCVIIMMDKRDSDQRIDWFYWHCFTRSSGTSTFQPEYFFLFLLKFASLAAIISILYFMLCILWYFTCSSWQW